MSRVSAWRAAQGTGRLASGGVRLMVDALVIGGPWLYLPALAGVLAWLAGLPWWIGTGAALALALFALADGKDGPSLDRFVREGQHRWEEARARAKARHVRREWPRLCERAGWVTPADLEKRRPVPSLRFARTMGRRLIVAWRPSERIAPGDYGRHVEELRRVVGAHSADWRPVTADPGTVVGMFGLQELPEMVEGPLFDRKGADFYARDDESVGGLLLQGPGIEGSDLSETEPVHPASEGVTRDVRPALKNADSGPVVGQTPDPSHGPTSSAVHQASAGFRFVLGVGTGRTDVTWDPAQSAHMLVTGTTGGGKGSVLRTLASQALAARWEVDVFDGQGAEYRWAEEAGACVTNLDVEMAAERMAELELHVNDVARVLWQHGVERWQDLPTPHHEYLRLVVLDDVLNFLMLRRVPEEKEADYHRSLFGSRLTRVAAQGRKVGVHLVIALQRADATLMGPAGGFLRSVLDARVAVGHLDPEGAAMMFGAGKDAALAYLDGTPGRAVAAGLVRGHVNPSPLQVHYLRAVDLRPSVGLVAS